MYWRGPGSPIPPGATFRLTYCPRIDAAAYSFYQEMEEIYELSPDPFLRPFLSEFSTLSEIFRLLRVSYEPHLDIDRTFLRKTADLVQEETHSGRILDPDKVYVLGENSLEVLTESDKPDTVKVFNLLKVLDRMVRERSKQAPYLVPIGERAEEVARRFQEGQVDTQQALEQLPLALDEADQAERERRESELSLEGFTLYWVLQGMKVPNAEALAHQIEAAFRANPHWRVSEAQERELRAQMYRSLLDAGVGDLVVEVVGGVLSLLKR
jgi:type I restriction enzyme R subunit